MSDPKSPRVGRPWKPRTPGSYGSADKQAGQSRFFSIASDCYDAHGLLHATIDDKMQREFDAVVNSLPSVIAIAKNIILKPIAYDEIRNTASSLGTIYKTHPGSFDFFVIGEDFLADVKTIQMIGKREVRFSIFGGPGTGERVAKKIDELYKKHIDSCGGSVNVEISWFYHSKDDCRHHQFTEPFMERVHQEAYPYLPELDGFIKNYLDSESSILLLMGRCGSGKTRLIRYLCQRAGELWSRMPKVVYTSDMRCLDDETMFIEFRCDDYDFMIMEDIDDGLGSRKQGNKIVHKFLASSDGFVAARNKKIILSTNLFISDVDEALVRPGRCYACVETRTLNADEATKLSEALGKKVHFDSNASVADVYNSVFQTSSSIRIGDSDVGFKKKK